MFGERLKMIRKQAGFTQKTLANELFVSQQSVWKWEKNDSSPNPETIAKMAQIFGVTADYLLGRTDSREPMGQHSPKPDLPADAQKVAEDYAALDQPGKNVVKVVIAEEGKRVASELARRRERQGVYDEFSDLDGEPVEPRLIPLYLTPAAAGYASPAFGEDFEYLEVDGGVPSQADFAVKIDGDSMEPYLMDGSIAYVNRDPLSNGDVGIFFVDGDIICKEYHRDRDGNVHLLSLNRERADADRHIPVDSGIAFACHGRVILPRH